MTGGGEMKKWAILSALALVVSVFVGSAGAAQTCFGKRATIRGTNGPDTLRGTNGPDVIFGGGGNDRIIGAGGNDKICSGPGNDVVKAGAGRDKVFGSS